MKFLTIVLLLSLSNTLLAQGLKQDFLCEATAPDGSVLEVSINNFDFSREVMVKKENKSCQLSITGGSHSERSVAPQLLIDFEAKESCVLSKKLPLLPAGFLKISTVKDQPGAYVLVLAGSQTLKCDVKHFNKKKLVDRINNSF